MSVTRSFAFRGHKPFVVSNVSVAVPPPADSYQSLTPVLLVLKTDIMIAPSAMACVSSHASTSIGVTRDASNAFATIEFENV